MVWRYAAIAIQTTIIITTDQRAPNAHNTVGIISYLYVVI